MGKRWYGDGKAEQGGQRLYTLLAVFDRRDGSPLADMIQAAREGWERSQPEMGEDNAWDAFDRMWDRSTSKQRNDWARSYTAHKHDAGCLRRKQDHPYLCTCGVSDEEMATALAGTGRRDA